MRTYRSTAPWWIAAPFMLGACVQIVGIDDPKPQTNDGNSSSTSSSSSSSSSTSSSSSSSSSSSGAPAGPWPGWQMPNPASAGLPNPSNYTEDAISNVVIDNVTGLMWQRTVDTATRTWIESGMYCQNLEQAGYTDWRLPWRIELVSLVDYTKTNAAIDPAFPDTPNSEFWTASTSAANSSDAWAVHFAEGMTITKNIGTAFRVRCVR